MHRSSDSNPAAWPRRFVKDLPPGLHEMNDHLVSVSVSTLMTVTPRLLQQQVERSCLPGG